MNPIAMQIIAIVFKPVIPSIQPTIATIVIHMNTIPIVSIVLILITIPPNILFLIIAVANFASISNPAQPKQKIKREDLSIFPLAKRYLISIPLLSRISLNTI